MNYRIAPLKPFGVLIAPIKQSVHIQTLNINHLRNVYRRECLIVLRGFESFKHSHELASYCEQWGQVSLWPFGEVLELIEQQDPKDHIFDNSYIPMHWDGMYRPEVPEYQIFHCVKAPLSGQGGRTLFANTLLALQHTPAKVKDVWRQVTGIYQRKMQYYNSKTISPIITQHPRSGKPVIRYNEPHCQQRGKFINPPDLAFTGVTPPQLTAVHNSLRQALYSSNHCYAHEWQSGDVVIADNFSLLHGRESFVSKSPRHLRRVHVLSDPPFDNPGLESHQ
ncbi:MAG: TauD/TfdA family dioxygenase [Coxiellaceae bacterium]|nr:TauD/TfdA family dioxygenase [Coxiellaceae bacterium]